MYQVQQLKIRLPADIKTFIELQADKNGSSLNSEVICALRERMERTTPARQSHSSCQRTAEQAFP
ncbi:Arc family DNA-binding protein [Methylobacterium sp. WL8]|nr:Arc family DNA-binding protein [Methylobacterium sp. WL8]TXN82008.1 Arc family DNA-binding protein [Methylobacterium sp. WL8]